MTLALPVLVACSAVAQQTAAPTAKAPPAPAPAAGSTVTYRTHIKPFIKAQCAECHGDDAPTLAEFKLDEKKYEKAKLGPRTDTYENLLQIVAYPDHGALMRRLDEGAWNLNRWKARGDVPGVTKEQLDKLQLKY